MEKRPRLPTQKPVKVFILAGQSNMVGFGTVENSRLSRKKVPPVDPSLGSPFLDNLLPFQPPQDAEYQPGTLRYLVNSPSTQAAYAHLHDANTNSWRRRDDVWVIEFGCADQAPPHQCRPDFNKIDFAGINGQFFGPELGFAHSVGDHYDAPILIIKTAWGGKSLAVDFLPPSIAQSSNQSTGPYYKAIIQFTQGVLDNLTALGFSTEYELAGFIWHQGWNDRVNPRFNRRYPDNIAALVNDVRQSLQSPNLPFILATTGMSGFEERHPRACSLMHAQLELPNDGRLEQPLNVHAIDTRPYWRAPEQSPANQSYHWNRNAETYYLIGKALGDRATGQYATHLHPADPKCEALYGW